MSRDRMRLVGMVALGALLLATPVVAQSGSPPTSHDPADPLLQTLLQAGQLPSSLQPGTIDEPAAFDIDQAAFDANTGQRSISRTWTGTRGPVLAVTDFRMLFPSAAQASAYLDAAEPVLSEQVASGLAPVMFEDLIGEDARHFFGVAEVDGRTLLLHDYLFRVGPIAAKVFVVGVDMREDTASNLAGAARARMALIESADPLTTPGLVGSANPVASGGPLLTHIPEAFRDSCAPAESPMGIGTAIECDLGDVAVSYTLLDDIATRDALLDDALSSVESLTANSSCREGPYAGPYDDVREHAGMVACPTDGSRVVFLWTRDDLPILTLAVSSTLDHAAMFDWWLTAGPVH